MNNNELLQAISELLDQKLEEKLETKLDQKLDQKLAPINERLENIETRVENIETRVENIEARVENIETRVENIEARVDAMEKIQNEEILPRIKQLEVDNETDIIPKFNEITSCYLSTYKRYEKDADLIEQMCTDIQIIKLAVQSHSEHLQKIS